MRQIEFGDFIEFNLPKEKMPISGASGSKYGVSIYIIQEVQRSIISYLKQNPRNESGGLLIGYPFVDMDDSNRKFVFITGHFPTNSANFGPTHFSVSPEELFQARPEIEKEFPGLVVVGWYHSHPGHGIFLSRQDMSIVEKIYNSDWHLAYVVDTLKNEDGFFAGPKAVSIKKYNILDKEPDCVIAIQKFNQALASEADGNLNALNEFRKWFISTMRQSLKHWFDLGHYQNLNLSEDIKKNESSLGYSEIDRDLDHILREAEQLILNPNQDLRSIVSIINRFNKSALDEKTAIRMKKILAALENAIEYPQSDRKRR